MKRILSLLLIVFSIELILPSCSESKAEREARIEQAQQETEEARQKAEDEAWNNSQVGQGWAFLKSQLKSPSSATLINYSDPDSELSREWTELLDRKGGSCAVYVFESQNGYGAKVVGTFIVVFKDGVPKCVLDARSASDPHYLAETLVNAGLERN